MQQTMVGAARGPLLLADISGYTSFLSAVTTAHADDAFRDGNIPPAYGLVSTLLDTILARTVPPFSLAKFEGDAVFVYATELDGLPRGSAVIECLLSCYAAFRGRLASARDVWSCRCDACVRVESLDLKFVLHAGSFGIQRLGGGTELIGSEVVMAHRLLKNRAAELVGRRPYALVTEAAAALLDVPCDRSLELTETYEHLPPITARVVVLEESGPPNA